MARLSAFILVIGTLFIAVFAWRRAHPPAVHATITVRGPAARMGADGPPGLAQQGAANTAARQGTPVGTNGYRLRSALTIPDQRLAVYLLAAYTAMVAGFAEKGQWPTDPSNLPVQRPANAQLTIVSSTGDGLKLSAVDTRALRQCDLFSGDSAKMAFGYAYDPSMPACGKMR